MFRGSRRRCQTVLGTLKGGQRFAKRLNLRSALSQVQVAQLGRGVT